MPKTVIIKIYVTQGGGNVKLEKGKLFWLAGETTPKVCCLRWDEQSTEYYSFLREKKDAGYRQIIISSEIFMSFLKFAVIEEKYSLLKIDFMEDDSDFNETIETLISQFENNPASFAILMDELRVVAEKSSIEIKNISFKSRFDNTAIRFFIQSNGIIGINSESFDYVSQSISAFLERCLF